MISLVGCGLSLIQKSHQVEIFKSRLQNFPRSFFRFFKKLCYLSSCTLDPENISMKPGPPKFSRGWFVSLAKWFGETPDHRDPREQREREREVRETIFINFNKKRQKSVSMIMNRHRWYYDRELIMNHAGLQSPPRQMGYWPASIVYGTNFATRHPNLVKIIQN